MMHPSRGELSFFIPTYIEVKRFKILAASRQRATAALHLHAGKNGQRLSCVRVHTLPCQKRTLCHQAVKVSKAPSSTGTYPNRFYPTAMITLEGHKVEHNIQMPPAFGEGREEKRGQTITSSPKNPGRTLSTGPPDRTPHSTIQHASEKQNS